MPTSWSSRSGVGCGDTLGSDVLSGRISERSRHLGELMFAGRQLKVHLESLGPRVLHLRLWVALAPLGPPLLGNREVFMFLDGVLSLESTYSCALLGGRQCAEPSASSCWARDAFSVRPASVPAMAEACSDLDENSQRCDRSFW